MNALSMMMHVARQNYAPVLRAALLPVFLAAPAAYGQSTMQDMPAMDHGSMGGMHGDGMQGMPGQGSAPDATGDKDAGSTSGAASGQAESQKRRGSQIALPAVPYHRNPDGTYDIPGTGMAMADNDINYLVLFDQLEYFNGRNDNGLAWSGLAWVGRDYNKLWLKTEGERVSGKSTGRVEGLWSRAVAAFWDLQFGVRNDFGQGPKRRWAVIGLQGIAPYWFNIDTAAYLGPSGRTAARAKVEYTFRLSQVTFLSPEFEVNAYGRSDRERGIGNGLSDASFGLRLRHEIRREVAPYIGINWNRKFGQTADFAREAGAPKSERQIVAGVRVWF